MEESYTNRELDEKLKHLDTLYREKHDDVMVKMGEILVQTTKTNGNVADLKMWRAYMTGGIAVLTALIVPLMIAFLKGIL